MSFSERRPSESIKCSLYTPSRKGEGFVARVPFSDSVTQALHGITTLLNSSRFIYPYRRKVLAHKRCTADTAKFTTEIVTGSFTLCSTLNPIDHESGRF
eukprot:6194949-Pleurochrysis_carterae.AAC.1